mgnify:CR=1 FL=1
MSVFYDPSSNLHPYECDGPGECIHCDQETTSKHDPNTCALCDDAAAIRARRDPDRGDIAIYGAGSQ